MNRTRKRLLAAAIAATAAAATTTVVTTQSTDDGALKAPMSGVVDRQHQPLADFQGIVNGWVVKVDWAELQPTPDVLNTAPIDAAVAAAKAQEARTNRPVTLKLRIYSGINAPEWAKAIGGPPVPVYDAADNDQGVTGRFWSAEYGDAYARLHRRLANRYDATPQIRDVVVSRCSTFYAEPLLRQASDPRTVASLLTAGYSLAADQACHRSAVAAHAVWKTTRSSMAFNPYQAIYPDGSTRNDVGISISLMDTCREILGARCVLGNNSIRSGDQGRLYPPLYDGLRTRGGSLYFQTATLKRVGSLAATIGWAVDQGAEYVELPAGYGVAVSRADMAALDSSLEANAR